MQFHARAPDVQMEALLKRSGHNRLYVTPKSWSHEVASDYAVVWIPGEKELVAAAALQLSGQLGLVRSRQRFGVRVASSQFERAHRQLKPGIDPPLQLDLQHFYKVSSVPHGARFQDVAAWLQQLSWKAKPLCSSG